MQWENNEKANSCRENIVKVVQAADRLTQLMHTDMWEMVCMFGISFLVLLLFIAHLCQAKKYFKGETDLKF